jgi:hypothetical protein
MNKVLYNKFIILLTSKLLQTKEESSSRVLVVELVSLSLFLVMIYQNGDN